MLQKWVQEDLSSIVGDDYGILFDILEPCTSVIQYLQENPSELSFGSKKNKPDPNNREGVREIVKKYYSGFTKSNFPKLSNLVPDDVVSLIMEFAFDLEPESRERNKRIHSIAMSAENCVGQLLERYLDSVLRNKGWVWVCGDLIKAVDFISRTEAGWNLLQIKNRSNSENSSSSAIRNNTNISKWWRINANSGATNWDNVPATMQNKGLSEKGFREFIENYIKSNKPEYLL